MNRFITSSIILTTVGLADSLLYSNVIYQGGRGTLSRASSSFTSMRDQLLDPRRHISQCSAENSMTSSSISDLRKEYSKQGLVENELPSDPFELFEAWFDEARTANVLEPNAMCLSTCKDNKPSARYVLLKGQDRRGFVWYTNYQSRKGDHLDSNPNAALTFWWGDLERSVRIEGVVEKVSAEESDAYFQSRPKSSQIGAWTSQQSRTIADRAALEQQELDIISKFDGATTIPRPDHWGGYRLVPSRIEFWKGRESRLHDRLVFSRVEGSDRWERSRLQP